MAFKKKKGTHTDINGGIATSGHVYKLNTTETFCCIREYNAAVKYMFKNMNKLGHSRTNVSENAIFVTSYYTTVQQLFQ